MSLAGIAYRQKISKMSILLVRKDHIIYSDQVQNINMQPFLV